MSQSLGRGAGGKKGPTNISRLLLLYCIIIPRGGWVLPNIILILWLGEQGPLVSHEQNSGRPRQSFQGAPLPANPKLGALTIERDQQDVRLSHNIFRRPFGAMLEPPVHARGGLVGAPRRYYQDRQVGVTSGCGTCSECPTVPPKGP